MKNVKYFAGFYDADGTFGIYPIKLAEDKYRIYTRAAVCQKGQDWLLEELSDEFDVGIAVTKSTGLSWLSLQGTKALRLIEHLKGHLVIKAEVAEYVASLNKLEVTGKELKQIRETIKQKRATGTHKNFPSRKWMAGYIDGDGSLITNYRKSRGGELNVRLRVVSHVSQKDGIMLMHKAFGGCVYCDSNSEVMRYELSLRPSNIHDLEYFGKHLRIKQKQYEFVHNILKNKLHFKTNGATEESNLELHQQLQRIRGTRND